MKKFYSEPTVELAFFEECDVLTASFTDNGTWEEFGQ